MVARIQSLGSCLVVLTLLLFAGSVGAQDAACDPEFSVCDDPVELCTNDGVPIDCDDADPCTSNICEANACLDPKDVEGCCVADEECDDANPCTTNACADNACDDDSDPCARRAVANDA